MRRTICILIAAAMIFTGAVLTSSADSEQNGIPTLYVDNTVWYKYLLYPLIIKDGVHCIPISFLQSLDDISYRFDDTSGCLLVTSEGGEYLSVLSGDGICLASDGTKEKIISFTENGEIYVESEKLGAVFGIEFEISEFAGAEMLRLCTENNLIPFTDVIKASASGESEFSDHTASQDEEIINYGNAFSVVADLSVMHIDTITSILDMADALSVTLTFAVSPEFIMGDYNIPILSEIASKGHTFALALDGKSEVPPKKQYEDFAERLSFIFRETSKLVIGDKVKALDAKGCIYLNNAIFADEIANVSAFSYDKNPLVIIKSNETKELSVLTALIMNAAEKGIAVTAVNPHTGN